MSARNYWAMVLCGIAAAGAWGQTTRATSGATTRGAAASTTPAATPAPAAQSGPVKVLKRFDFEPDVQGWQTEAGEGGTTKSERVSPGFRGSAGALRTTGTNQYNTLAPLVNLAYPGADTKVTVAYRTTDGTGLQGQGMGAPAKKNLHGAAATPFRDGVWGVATIPVDKWVPYGGNEVGRDQTFSTLMIMGAVKAGSRKAELLIDDVVVWQGTDTTPPAAVAAGKGTVDAAAGEVVVTWPVPADDVAVARFHVYRSLSPDFTPAPANRIATLADNTCRDGAINNFGTYYYRITAEDASGNVSAPSPAVKVDVKP